MKILKMGNTEETEEICKDCGYIFLYNFNDVKQVLNSGNLFKEYCGKEVVNCPCCNNEIAVKYLW